MNSQQIFPFASNIIPRAYPGPGPGVTGVRGPGPGPLGPGHPGSGPPGPPAGPGPAPFDNRNNNYYNNNNNNNYYNNNYNNNYNNFNNYNNTNNNKNNLMKSNNNFHRKDNNESNNNSNNHTNNNDDNDNHNINNNDNNNNDHNNIHNNNLHNNNNIDNHNNNSYNSNNNNNANEENKINAKTDYPAAWRHMTFAFIFVTLLFTIVSCCLCFGAPLFSIAINSCFLAGYYEYCIGTVTGYWNKLVLYSSNLPYTSTLSICSSFGDVLVTFMAISLFLSLLCLCAFSFRYFTNREIHTVVRKAEFPSMIVLTFTHTFAIFGWSVSCLVAVDNSFTNVTPIVAVISWIASAFLLCATFLTMKVEQVNQWRYIRLSTNVDGTIERLPDWIGENRENENNNVVIWNTNNNNQSQHQIQNQNQNEGNDNYTNNNNNRNDNNSNNIISNNKDNNHNNRNPTFIDHENNGKNNKNNYDNSMRCNNINNWNINHNNSNADATHPSKNNNGNKTKINTNFRNPGVFADNNNSNNVVDFRTILPVDDNTRANEAPEHSRLSTSSPLKYRVPYNEFRLYDHLQVSKWLVCIDARFAKYAQQINEKCVSGGVLLLLDDSKLGQLFDDQFHLIRISNELDMIKDHKI